MTTTPESSEGKISSADFHREIADELFGHVLGLLERDDRTCEENARMIHAAHASRFHYELGGSVANLAMGEWQCARVHAAMGHADAGLYHAFRYLEMAESYGMGPFHLAYAHTAVARAAALRDAAEADRHFALARELSGHAEEGEERRLLEEEFAALERAGVTTSLTASVDPKIA